MVRVAFKYKEMVFSAKNRIFMEGIRWKSVMNMTNSIIGVSILAMPYCFAQCGIILGSLTLLCIAFLTSYSCKILIKSSEIKGCNSYETLAMNSFGPIGKIFTEICVIFMLFGTMVTYQQTLSDSTSIVPKIFALKDSDLLRYSVMVLLTVSIALPLSLSRKLDFLAGVSALSVTVFLTFSIYMFFYAYQVVSIEDWKNKIIYWQFSGLFKSIPIYCVSFACQTVLFVVYEELPNQSVEKMYKIIDASVMLVFFTYLITGLFGYIAFCNTEIHGNVVTHINASVTSEVILAGIAFCVLFGYPFMVVPCRNSLSTLLFSSHPKQDFDLTRRVPPNTFNYLTFAIIIMTTITAILVPNMEFVLSLVGSTTGSIICYIIPALIFMNATSKTNEKKTNGRNTFISWIDNIIRLLHKYHLFEPR